MIGALANDSRDFLRVEFRKSIQRSLGEYLLIVVVEFWLMGEIAGHTVVVVETLLSGQEFGFCA